jgi:methyltransferase (TIGR00027 family)
MIIDNVSDTARWVAYYRAMETERPDALFRDPWARELAGEQGRRAVDEIAGGRAMAPALIVRTAVLDRQIQETIAREQVDLVLNLAAGLDTRPWRMELPDTLTWVDADLPGILDYKTGRMARERPKCSYQPVAVDLTDAGARGELFARLGQEFSRVLVISEGLVIYLDPAQVADLARALHGQPGFRWWLLDLASPVLLQIIARRRSTALERAPFKFAPAEGPEFFRSTGWQVASYHSAMEDGRRLRREMRGAWFWRLVMRFMPAERREAFRTMSGIVMLRRGP